MECGVIGEPHAPGITHTMPCPDCRQRNGCRQDCGAQGCRCRGVCLECRAVIRDAVRRAFGDCRLTQEVLL